MPNLIRKLTSIFNRNSSGELMHVMSGIDRSLKSAKEDIRLLDYEYVIGTATGEWLDEWGSWFKVSRRPDEGDASYRERIIFSAIRKRNSITALIETTRRVMPHSTVEIYEPYNDLLTFNQSVWNGKDRFKNSDFYRYGVAVIRTSVPATDELMREISRVKSGGTRIYFQDREGGEMFFLTSRMIMEN